MVVRRGKRVGLQQVLDLSTVEPRGRCRISEGERQHAIHSGIINHYQQEDSGLSVRQQMHSAAPGYT